MRHGKREEREAKKRETFLRALESTGSVFRACQIARLPRATAYRWRDADREFASAWQRSQQLGSDALQDEAIRRAVEGTARKKFYKGQPIIDPETGEQYVEYDYSDALLIRMLEARRPDLFKPRSDMPVGTHIQVHTMQVCTTPALNELPDQSDQTNECNGRILGS